MVSGSPSSMPARNRRVFSPPLNPLNGRKREIPANCHESSAAWARSSIFQSSSSRTKCSSAVSPFRMAWRAVSLRSMPNACATVRPSYCPKCWGTWKRCPEQYALPPPGDTSPARIRIRVDFPQPLLPVSAVFSPELIIRLRLENKTSLSVWI